MGHRVQKNTLYSLKAKLSDRKARNALMSESSVHRLGLRHNPRTQRVYLETVSGGICGRFPCEATADGLLTSHSHSLICRQTDEQTES